MADWLSGVLGLGGALGSAYLGSQSAQDASDAQMQALAQAQQVSQEAIAQGRSDILATAEPALEDIISGYQGGISVLEEPGQAESMARALSGVMGPEAQQQALANYQASPGQEWLRGEQERALTRNAGAIGGLGSGLVRSALQEEAMGRASTNLQQDLQNMVQMSLPEQTRASNIANILTAGGGQIANFRAGLGSNLANISLGGAAQQLPLITGTGASQAAGILGVNNAYQQGFGSAGRTLGEIYG